MGRHTTDDAARALSLKSPAGAVRPIKAPVREAAKPASRVGRSVLQVMGVLAVAGCFLVNIVDPYSGGAASAHFTVSITDTVNLPTQTLASGGDYQAVNRDGYSVTEAPEPEPIVVAVEAPASSSPSSPSSAFAPPAGAPDPGSAQAYAYAAVQNRGWPETEYDCLVSLWNRESGWRYNAYNASSGAYGIPQALPGNKMASVADDWETNAGTQIEWGLGYISGRYETPCGAWAHSESAGWY